MIKKILITTIAVLFTSLSAQADTCGKSLTGLFTAFQAKKLCGTFLGVGTSFSESLIPNADNTLDIGSTSFSIRTIYYGTSRIAKTSDILRVRQDAQRLFTWDASSDSAFTWTWGDAGVTATQGLIISASTADADDDSTVYICGGGGTAATRGSCIYLAGEEAAGGGDVYYYAGTGDTHVFNVAGSPELTIGDDKMTVNGASFSVVPGATSFLFRNNADNATNLGITDAGVVTARAGLVATAGGTTNSSASDFVVSTSGGTLSLQEATAGAACSGTLTANGATPVVVSTSCATTGSRVFLSRTSAETGTVNAWKSALSNGVSFSITSEAADTGTYDWLIVHEAP